MFSRLPRYMVANFWSVTSFMLYGILEKNVSASMTFKTETRASIFTSPAKDVGEPYKKVLCNVKLFYLRHQHLCQIKPLDLSDLLLLYKMLWEESCSLGYCQLLLLYCTVAVGDRWMNRRAYDWWNIEERISRRILGKRRPTAILSTRYPMWDRDKILPCVIHNDTATFILLFCSLVAGIVRIFGFSIKNKPTTEC